MENEAPQRKQRKQRTTFTVEQQRVFQEYYNKSKYLSTVNRDELSQKLNLNPNQVEFYS